MSEQLPTEPGEPKKEKADVATRYVVLQRDDSGFWSEVQISNARSAEAAIRDFKKEGTYVAIPARSFKPVTVKAEVVTTLKLEDAT